MMLIMNLLPDVRVWDLQPGDTFRGKIIHDIYGLVGIAHNPVAVLTFREGESRPAKFPAAYAENMQHGDEVAHRARHWICAHNFHEGDGVNLRVLRSEVMNLCE